MKLTRASKFNSNNYMQHERSGDRSKILSIKEYLDKIKPYLRNIFIDLQKYDTWKFNSQSQLTLLPPKITTKNKKYIQKFII